MLPRVTLEYAYLMRRLNDFLGNCLLDSAQVDVEVRSHEVSPIDVAQIDFRVYRRVRWESDLLLFGSDQYRRGEACQPTRSEQLFRIGAGTVSAWNRKLDFEMTVRTAGRPAIAAARRVNLRGVKSLFQLRHLTIVSGRERVHVEFLD
jgi:hypothetical protein